MNDHLIKNLWISIIQGILFTLIVLLLILYLVKNHTNHAASMNWISGAVILFLSLNFWWKENTILLEIHKNDLQFVIISYTPFKGKKEMVINAKDIIQIDSYNDLRIRYQKNTSKMAITFKITAEPWNDLFAQIKSIKLAEQENRQPKT